MRHHKAWAKATASRCSLILLLAIAASTPTLAHEINERLSVSGVASLGIQFQRLRGAGGNTDRCRGALSFQPELSFRPGEAYELSFKLGFAHGNGLNDATLFDLAPWAADLEDSIENIKGGTRDHLLTAWYRLVVLPLLAIAADVQYLRDDLRSSKDPEEWVLGLRITTRF